MIGALGESGSFLGHLQELRTRLWRFTLTLLALGALSLYFARELFELLMRPVLAALPEEQRQLIYTSGIEELNVLLKVGLYAGLLLSLPVALFQLWRFVAPGLLPGERRAAGPFVALGTACFLAGAAFCYFAVLPPMFRFLLRSEEGVEQRAKLALVRARTENAERHLALGQDATAHALALGAEELALPFTAAEKEPGRWELAQQLDRLGRLIDLSLGRFAEGATTRLALSAEHHQLASEALSRDELALSLQELELARGALAEAHGAAGPAFDACWRAERALVSMRATSQRSEWTRPMLSMGEQLSLVLILEVAFGLIFEMPLVMALLAALGLLKLRHLLAGQRYAIVGCVAAAAVLTPTGDLINLSLMAVPMIVCFEVGVVLVWLLERRSGEDSNSEDGALAA